ncbi:MAG TPA: efflux RND transporter periplasmic adaptor subunit [Gemmata sp.]|nr:efflux RND transporter periplasmic adaptor subunit [Gemmata sp.]
MSKHILVVLNQCGQNLAFDVKRSEDCRFSSITIGSSSSSCRFALSFCAFLSLAFLNFGCGRTANPVEKVPPAPIKWEEARQVFLEEWTELVGSTQPLPEHAARVTSPVAGRVIAVLPNRDGKPVVEGQTVEEGEVLIRLDASLILANLAKAEAAKKVLLSECEVAAIAVKQASLDLKSLEELKRNQNTQTILVSPIMLEKASLALDSAQASLRALSRKLEAADKEEEALKLEIRLYTLTAPRKGTLGRLQVVMGQTLPAGNTIAEIVSIDDEIDVLCFVSAADARKLQIGQKAHYGGIEKDPAAEATADPEGKVVYIADQAESETGTFAVKVRFPNRDLKLRASSVARVRIVTKPDKYCWAVPESALMEDQDPPTIIVVEDVAVTKNADGKDEQTGKVRRLRAVIGMRDRYKHLVELVRLEDSEKKWHGDLEHALIVIAKGQGLQTGDVVKLDEDEDEDAAKPTEKP